MLRATARINAKPLENVREFVRNFDNEVFQIAQFSYASALEEAADVLNRDPGPVKHPIKWTSDRQRRAFFASNGFGRGIPTQRTGRVRSWVAVIERTRGGTITARLVNPVSYARFVYGDLNFKSRAVALKPQQQFHRNTGWPLAQPVVDEATQKGRQQFEREFNRRLQALGNFTIRRRSR